MFYIDKLLSQLGFPLGFSLSLGLFALLLRLFRRPRLALGLAVFAGGWLWLWSMPVFSDWVRRSLEGEVEMLEASEVEPGDVIVLLGGGVGPAPPDWPYPNLNSASDRVWHAARLYHAGKAPRIIASGGFAYSRESAQSEAAAMREFLVDLGVPEQDVVLEEQSRNTRENAILTAQWLQSEGLERVLLVTSALHMPRSLATFRAAGVEAIPAATDFEVRRPGEPAPWDLRRYIPSASALEGSTRAFKEHVGFWVYRWRGWTGEKSG